MVCPYSQRGPVLTTAPPASLATLRSQQKSDILHRYPRCRTFPHDAQGQFKGFWETHTQLKLLVILPALVRRLSAPTSASRAAEGYPSSLTTACALITLGVLSSGAVEALRPRISRARSIAVQAMALEEMHSRNKQMIAAAVGRRGKWRTSWRGVTTKPGRP